MTLPFPLNPLFQVGLCHNAPVAHGYDIPVEYLLLNEDQMLSLQMRVNNSTIEYAVIFHP